MQNTIKELGYMLDSSRGAVARVETVKRLIDILSKWGYTYLMLYTEDTYSIKDEPYFGYMRGRYSEEEIKEIDAYSRSKGMELRPCIETLAHLGRLQANDNFFKYFDIEDILLVRDDETYKLIEKMFASVASAFTSRHIHIGMDEAFFLGRGHYIDKYGYEKKDKIIEYHLKRVSEIARKYGFVCDIWADMLLNAYHESKDSHPLTLPDNILPMIWRYSPKFGKKKTEEEIEEYKKVTDRPLSYAGGIIKWMGYVPANTFSLPIVEEQIEASKKEGISNFLVTGWGDGAAEASQFSTLPGLFGASLLAKGKKVDETTKPLFKEAIGIAYDDFMKVDRLGYLDPSSMKDGEWNNLSFLHLYNDPLQNQLLEVELPKYKAAYKKAIAEMEPLTKDKEFGYIFSSFSALAEVDSHTADLGRRALEAYKAHKTMAPIIEEAKKAIEALKVFIPIYEEQWNKENKSFGLEKQHIRLGGLEARLSYFVSILTKYENKEVSSIDEYEETHLPKLYYGETINPDAFSANFYRYLVSAGILNDC